MSSNGTLVWIARHAGESHFDMALWTSNVIARECTLLARAMPFSNTVVFRATPLGQSGSQP
jgi:hypothetical protein